jgi:hypothetical protein
MWSQMNKLIRILVVGFCMMGLAGCGNPKLDDEGRAFVAKMLEGQLKHWDGSKLNNLLDPSANISPQDLTTIFSMYEDCLEALESVGDISRTQYKLTLRM